MKKITTIVSILVLIVVAFAGCQKYDPRYDGEWNDSKVKSPKQEALQMVYVSGGNIYTYNFRLQRPRLILAGVGAVNNISISPRYDKIAYKTTSANIVVIDSSGAMLQTIPSSSNVYHFEWLHDNDVLYGVVPSYTVMKPVKLYGSGNLPTNLPNAILQGGGIAQQLDFYYITKDNDVFYGGKTYNYAKLGYIRRGSTADYKTVLYNISRYERFKVGNYNIDGTLQNAICYNNVSGSNWEAIQFEDRSFNQISGSQYEAEQFLWFYQPKSETSTSRFLIESSGNLYLAYSNGNTATIIGNSPGSVPVFDFK